MKQFYLLILAAGLILCSATKSYSQDANDTVFITASLDTLRDGKVYVLNSNVGINRRLYVKGNAILHLTDGYTLTVSNGIQLEGKNQLTINGDENNTGKLVCQDGGQADQECGIGANTMGNLTINGGTVQSTGSHYGAGIGGSRHNTGPAGSITINGGIVTAQGGRYAAGIGGGYNDWVGVYGRCMTITITGGQVTAIGGEQAPGIGPGRPYNNNCLNPSGTVTLGLTNPTDFIQLTGKDDEYGIGKLVTNFTFADGNYLMLEDGTAAIPESLRSNQSFKLVPADESFVYDLSKAAVVGIENTYYFTNGEISVSYELIDILGSTLVEGTDFTKVIRYNNNQTVTKVTSPGEYEFTFTGAGSYSGSISATTTVIVHRPESVRQTTYTADGGELTWTDPYYVNSWKVELCEDNSFSNVIAFYPTQKPFILTDLTPDASYFARIKAYAGPFESEWSDVIRFYPTAKKWLGVGYTDENSLLPICVGYEYSLSEQIYTASEIGQAGTIRSIDFCFLSPSCTRNVNIYLLHTAKTVFDSKSDWVRPAESDKVFSGNVTLVENGAWTTITLQTPFAYNGTDNLMLVMHDNTGNYTTAAYFLSYSSASQVSLFWRGEEAIDPIGGTLPVDERTARTSDRSQIRLVIEPFDPTGMETVLKDDVRCTKVIENGILYLKRNGSKYNVQGQRAQ